MIDVEAIRARWSAAFADEGMIDQANAHELRAHMRRAIEDIDALAQERAAADALLTEAVEFLPNVAPCSNETCDLCRGTQVRGRIEAHLNRRTQR